MPKYAQSSDGWLGRTIGSVAAGSQAANAGRTQYITEPSGSRECQAIIGNLAADQEGNATGLSGFGIAVHASTGWVALPAGVLQLAEPAVRHLAFGAVTLKWAASTNSATATVTHGLGTTPLSVVATAFSSPAFEEIPLINVVSAAPTTFAVNAELRKSITGEIAACWIAIG